MQLTTWFSSSISTALWQTDRAVSVLFVWPPPRLPSGHSVLEEELPPGSGGPAGLRQRGAAPGGLQHPEESVVEGRHQQQESPPRHRLCVRPDDLRPAGHQGNQIRPAHRRQTVTGADLSVLMGRICISCRWFVGRSYFMKHWWVVA